MQDCQYYFAGSVGIGDTWLSVNNFTLASVECTHVSSARTAYDYLVSCKVSNAETDQEAVGNANAISGPLYVSSTLGTRLALGSPDGGGDGLEDVREDVRLLQLMRSSNPPDMDNMLDIINLTSCPREMDKVGMRGLYEFMKLVDTSQEIFSREAKAISEMIDRVLPCLGSTANEEDKDTLVTMVTELRDLCNMCTDDKVIRG
ncbi:hypothetical protein Moror_775 [Moniliophthora roreri MCA 2997]|uniref:Uncharacterized protein n=1 Tax=Moniliophthora roreri (strain MCA 2997) TaxID=1381753 RepID=V2X845_MONRO|nr:hypothetical protein Moror_775 [Moniliophthora roreri MCA 2997]